MKCQELPSFGRRYGLKAKYDEIWVLGWSRAGTRYSTLPAHPGPHYPGYTPPPATHARVAGTACRQTK